MKTKIPRVVIRRAPWNRELFVWYLEADGLKPDTAACKTPRPTALEARADVEEFLETHIIRARIVFARGTE